MKNMLIFCLGLLFRISWALLGSHELSWALLGSPGFSQALLGYPGNLLTVVRESRMWCPRNIGRDSWVWGELETLWS